MKHGGSCRKLTLALLCAFFILPQYSFAQKSITLQPYHWVYDYADELKLRYPELISFWATQPQGYNTTAHLLKSHDSTAVFASFLSKKIARNLYKFGRKGPIALEYPMIYLGSSLSEKYGSQVGNDRILSSLRLYSGARFSRRLSIFNAMNIDQSFGEDKQYIGKVWRDVTAITEQAYAQYQADDWLVKFGRDYLRWGRGYDAALAVSHASRPFDQFFLQLRSRRAQFSYFISKLNNIKIFSDADSLQQEWANRYMSGGRLEFKLFNNKLELAFSQFVLWGGTHGLEFYYLNPFVFYHGEQLNEDPEIRANTLGLIDFSFYPRSGIEVYGQLLIDDIQIEKKVPGDLEPNELGLLIGARSADVLGVDGLTLGLEYTRVTNRTYNTLPLAEKFTHRNKPIGHFLGNDFDRWLFYGRKYIWKNLLLNARMDFRRHGEGRYNGDFDTPWLDFETAEGYSEPFPTGVVEYARIYTLDLRWHPKSYFYLSMIGRAGDFSNYQNKPGEERTNRELYLKLWLEWSFFSEI